MCSSDLSSIIYFTNIYILSFFLLLIAAYNAGIGSVSDWQSGDGDISSNIEYAETSAYLAHVNDAYRHYRELYPDELVNS